MPAAEKINGGSWMEWVLRKLRTWPLRREDRRKGEEFGVNRQEKDAQRVTFN